MKTNFTFLNAFLKVQKLMQQSVALAILVSTMASISTASFGQVAPISTSGLEILTNTNGTNSGLSPTLIFHKVLVQKNQLRYNADLGTLYWEKVNDGSTSTPNPNFNVGGNITSQSFSTIGGINLTGTDNLIFKNTDPGDVIFQNGSGSEYARVYAGTDGLNLSTASVRRLSINSSGDATFSNNLQVNGSLTTNGLTVNTSFIANPGAIEISAQNTTREGGELRLNGAGSNNGLILDNLDGRLRVFNRNNGGELFTALNNGNFGIGTTAPGYKLQVSGPQGDAQNFYVDGRMRLGGNSAGIWGGSDNRLFFGRKDANFFWIYSDGGDRFNINLGNGNATFSNNLQVNGNLTSNGGLTTNGLTVNTSFTADPGAIQISAQNTTQEGGELRLLGAGSNNGLIIDNLSGRFRVFNSNNGGELFTALNNGNFGIGVSNPQNKLSVNGRINSTEVLVTATVADYVFEPDYNLLTLAETEAFIKQHKHLPGVPGKAEIEKDGYQLGLMTNKVLEKVEELTLHLIELKKENDALKKKVDALEHRE